MSASSAAAYAEGMRRTLDMIVKAKSFGRVLSRLELVEGRPGRCTVSFVPREEDLNLAGTLHGGLSATLVDVVTSVAVAGARTEEEAKGPFLMPGVSVELGVRYLSAPKLGEPLLGRARAVRVGRSVAFAELQLVREEDGAEVVTGTHTMFVGNPAFKNVGPGRY